MKKKIGFEISILMNFCHCMSNRREELMCMDASYVLLSIDSSCSLGSILLNSVKNDRENHFRPIA